MPRLRAFSICPTCSELYPSFRGCPVCDGDAAEPNAPAVGALAEPAPPPVELELEPGSGPAAASARVQGANLIPYVAALSVGVVVACGLLLALISS